ncbi:hypothetical protein PSHT_05085, partial [Puccinia striiformis]
MNTIYNAQVSPTIDKPSSYRRPSNPGKFVANAAIKRATWNTDPKRRAGLPVELVMVDTIVRGACQVRLEAVPVATKDMSDYAEPDVDLLQKGNIGQSHFFY